MVNCLFRYRTLCLELTEYDNLVYSVFLTHRTSSNVNNLVSRLKYIAGTITAISAILSSMYVISQFYVTTQQMSSVVQQNTVAIKSLELSIRDVPLKMMIEHDAGVLFSTLNFPDSTPIDRIDDKIDLWFKNSWGIQIQSMINLCKHDKKILSTIIYRQNVRKYCPRFGTFVLIDKIMNSEQTVELN